MCTVHGQASQESEVVVVSEGAYMYSVQVSLSIKWSAIEHIASIMLDQ